MLTRIIQAGSALPGIYSVPGASDEQTELVRDYLSKFPTLVDRRDYVYATLRDPRTGQNIDQMMRWGFIPWWVKDKLRWPYEKEITWEKVQRHYKREQQGKPTSEQPWRCLIPATSVILTSPSDLHEETPLKHPAEYALGLASGHAFALAGVWEGFHHPQTGLLYPLGNFGVLTCPANSLVGTIQNRMPVIIARENYGRWLAGIDRDPQDLIAPFSPKEMSLRRTPRRRIVPGFIRRIGSLSQKPQHLRHVHAYAASE